MNLFVRLLAVSNVLWLLSGSNRADDVFEGLQPGLIAQFRDSLGTQSRILPDVAGVWGTASPLPGIAADRFTVEWTGILFVRSDTTYRFHVHGQGRFQVSVQGTTVLEGETAEPGWVSGPPTPLEFGFLPLRVTLEKTAPAAALQLYWSSDLFPLEPVPHHLLFHDAEDAAIRLVERGRALFDAHRCNRCHVSATEPLSDEAPPFIAIAADLNPDWLVAKLEHKHAEAAHSLMPSFGFSHEEAEAVAAWLWHINQPPRIIPLRPVEVDQKNPPPDGLTLVRSVGCLACHKLGELGQSGPFGGGDLSHIGAKRTGDWLYTWLAQPDRINPERRMPLFKLTPTERSQIATALSQLGRTPEMSYERPHYPRNTEIVQRGRDLVRQARCFNCHKTPAMEIDTRGLPQLDRPVEDWSKSCLAEHPDLSRGRPAYPQADRVALKAYVETLIHRRSAARTPAERNDAPPAQPSPEPHGPELSAYERGRLLLEQRNCLACHERLGGTGIVATAGQAAETDRHLRGLSEALIPPNLTAVGDKLRDAALAEAVGGDQKTVRLPWLRVRMPRFQHTDEERAALLAYFIGHDRIPEGAPGRPEADPPPAASADETDVDSETLLLGRQLVGVGGFSCIACHTVGEYEPRNTALGTRGSDLKGLGGRMRQEFFHRWTRAPLRIVPGMEMPSYEDRAVRGLLDDDIDAQLALLWKALNSPRFEAPTNPSQVEQLLTLQPGDRPRVLRDVFTVSQENGGGYVPRSFAVGFDNGHSILYDLDRGGVRDWTFGDFARQRTEGKSWYWDLAGAPVVAGLEPRCEFVLRRGDDWFPLEPPPGEPILDLQSYRITAEEVQLTYRLRLPAELGEAIEVRETWTGAPPSPAADRRRITRRIEATRIASGAELWFLPTPVPSRLLNAAVERDAAWRECGNLGTGVPVGSGREIHYLADAGVLPTPPPPRPELPLPKEPITTAPGFEGVRLPISTAIMPTALTIAPDGTLAVTSLKGEVVLLRDDSGDGLPETVIQWEEGLAAPFGVLPADPQPLAPAGRAQAPRTWLVVHKPELLALTDVDGDGTADDRRIVASGWGYTDNYHDWSAGPVRGDDGCLYVATSSDYAQPGRPEELCRWRGKVLRIAPEGTITPIAHELRYPMGIAFDSRGRLFVSDQQGVANCFNEINHIVEGARYGVKGLYDPDSDQPETRAAIQIPHPWTRSVNGIFFIPESADPAAPLAPFAGHGIGCEYNNRFLIRFSLQEVAGQLQGAVYLFTHSTWQREAETFLGPMCGAVAPNGDLYIGSIHDSGWLGGMNTGEIVRLRPTGRFPNGIREIRALPDGFEIEFLRPIDAAAAARPQSYSLSGYTRVWKGSYATEDSGQYVPQIRTIEVSDDARTVRLHVDRLEAAFVYDVAVQPSVGGAEALFPHVGYYTMNRVPAPEGR